MNLAVIMREMVQKHLAVKTKQNKLRNLSIMISSFLEVNAFTGAAAIVKHVPCYWLTEFIPPHLTQSPSIVRNNF